MTRHLEDSGRSREIFGKEAVQTRLRILVREISHPLPRVRNDGVEAVQAGDATQVRKFLATLQ